MCNNPLCNCNCSSCNSNDELDCCKVMDCVNIHSSDNSLDIQKTEGCGLDIKFISNNIAKLLSLESSTCIDVHQEFIDGKLVYTLTIKEECLGEDNVESPLADLEGAGLVHRGNDGVYTLVTVVQTDGQTVVTEDANGYKVGLTQIFGANQTVGSGISVPVIVVDKYGRITGLTTKTINIPSEVKVNSGECISMVKSIVGGVVNYTPTLDWACIASKLCPLCSDPLFCSVPINVEATIAPAT